MRLLALQTDIAWEDSEKNRAAIAAQLSFIGDGADLILLPEMFNTGFSSNTRLAESMDGITMQWLQENARTMKSVIGGSLMIDTGNQIVNRFVWVKPDGDVEYYDKRHLFRMAGEHEHFKAGTRRTIVECKGVRICLQICYDLRFPVWSRNTFDGENFDYDCLVYVANWPSPRANAWRDLLRARAIENVCYCVGLNRVGKDDNDLTYLGDSVILDFKGLDIQRADDGPQIISADLDLKSLWDFRKKFPVGLDADRFEISL